MTLKEKYERFKRFNRDHAGKLLIIGMTGMFTPVGASVYDKFPEIPENLKRATEIEKILNKPITINQALDNTSLEEYELLREEYKRITSEEEFQENRNGYINDINERNRRALCLYLPLTGIFGFSLLCGATGRADRKRRKY